MKPQASREARAEAGSRALSILRAETKQNT